MQLAQTSQSSQDLLRGQTWVEGKRREMSNRVGGWTGVSFTEMEHAGGGACGRGRGMDIKSLA